MSMYKEYLGIIFWLAILVFNLWDDKTTGNNFMAKE